MSWTDERIDRLKELWSKGVTASQIAEELGGVSRNAVIGKAHRLGLQSRPSPVKPNEPAPKAKAKAKAPPPKGRAKAAPPPPPPKPAPKAKAEPRASQPQAAPAVGAAPVAQAPQPQIRSIGPGGFVRQGPGDQQAPIPPAPPRRLVPAKPSPEIADKTGLLDLNEKICKWPIGHPGEPDFHFCGGPPIPAFLIASSIAASPIRPSCRAATASRRRRCRSAGRASAEAGDAVRFSVAFRERVGACRLPVSLRKRNWGVQGSNSRKPPGMSADDLAYYQRRAETELELAQRANDAKAVQVHYELATAYLEKVHAEEARAEA